MYEVAYGTKRGVIGITGAAAVAAAIVATLFAQGGDRPGSLLFWLFAIVLVLITAYLSLLNPRLAAGESGVAIRTIKGTIKVPWSDLQTRVKSTRRFGRDGKTLELEFPGQPGLVVFGWLELGEQPEDVYEALNRIRRA